MRYEFVKMSGSLMPTPIVDLPAGALCAGMEYRDSNDKLFKVVKVCLVSRRSSSSGARECGQKNSYSFYEVTLTYRSDY